MRGQALREIWLAIRLARLALAIAVLAFAALPGFGQNEEAAGASLVPEVGAPAEASSTAADGLDYQVWADVATRADALLATRLPDPAEMAEMRALLVDWREALAEARKANLAQMAGARSQIADLGAAPANGAAEAEDAAILRSQLAAQLVRLQEPGRQADDAYEQADELISKIDASENDQAAEEMLRLWPSPVNPANWPAALAGMTKAATSLVSETATRLKDPKARGVLLQNLPLLLLLFVSSIMILWRGRRWLVEALDKLPLPANARAARLSMALASLGQIIIPVLACVALTIALRRTGLLGPLGLGLADVIATGGLIIFTSLWLGRQLLSANSPLRGMTGFVPERWAEGRFLIFGCGLVLALAQVRRVVGAKVGLDDATASVTLFPLLVFGGLILLRIGRLLAQFAAEPEDGDDSGSTPRNFVRLVARASIGIGLIGPVLAAIGYNTAATAMIHPAVVSLGLLGLLAFVQQLTFDLWAVITKSASSETDGLVPVLLGFVIALASMPAFALVWGADFGDLLEVWVRFAGGFNIGQTRISPLDFLLFVAIFAFGYSATRMLQNVMRNQILPRIAMDQGGRNAITVGTGYVGLFLAALFAINTTGIDLSGLAIVAGALSVGIGFGLQNIVSNFVSGIILLIERPVSEGDWIEVGGVHGTVKSISVRSTRIQTFDRTDVIVPNTDLVAGQVTNWTRFNLTGRLIVPVGVAFGSDTRRVSQVLREIAEAEPMALLTPPPMVAFIGFGADSMNFEIRVILRDINFSVAVRSEINHEIVRRFGDEGIEIPFAQSEITLRNASEIAEMLQAANGAKPKAPRTGTLHIAATDKPALPPTAQDPVRDHVPGEGLSADGHGPDGRDAGEDADPRGGEG